MLIKNEKVLRCQCYNISNNKLCKKKTTKLYIVENKFYCINHFRYYRDVYALKIQSIWKGFKQRKLLEIIYKRLPDDLQYKILFYIKKDIYENRRMKILKKIVAKKIFEMPMELIYNYGINTMHNSNNYTVLYYTDRIVNVCYLYNKYVSLLDINHTQLIISLIYRLKDFIKNIDDLLNGYIYTTKDVIDFCKIKIIYKQMKWLIGERDN
tara:strand:- start:6581 stop:7210 length:630 start_codon:yes stop_codon:yes gene_type:complete